MRKMLAFIFIGFSPQLIAGIIGGGGTPPAIQDPMLLTLSAIEFRQIADLALNNDSVEIQGMKAKTEQVDTLNNKIQLRLEADNQLLIVEQIEE